MNKIQKSVKRDVDGVLLLNKASGLSSNSALQQVRRLYQAKKAGHTGVLDPLATGLLPICFGQATKFAQYLLDADKGYVATIKFGEATTTGDVEGEVIETSSTVFGEAELLQACQALTGKIEQMPPMYSALKYEGKPLYEYARKGIEIGRKKREIEIYSINLIKFSFPVAKISVSCSKGTYIRTLAEDIAKKLGSVAHLIGLDRTNTAGFSLENTHRYTDLTDFDLDALEQRLLSSDVLVAHFPELFLSEGEITRLKYGQSVQIEQKYGKMDRFRVYNEDTKEFVGLVVFDGESSLNVLRLMNTSLKEVKE